MASWRSDMNIEPETVHRLKNQLAIILGFCELLLTDLPEGDQRRLDVLRIQDAGKSALGELPPLAAHEIVSAIETPAEAKDGH
jgi:hypothetical protein